MKKTLLLSGVAAVALMAGVATAQACEGPQCTPVNSFVTGNALASGKAFEAAGAVAIGTNSAQAGVAGVAGSHSTAGLTRDVNCVTGCITGNASTQNYAGYAAEAAGTFTATGGIAGTSGLTNVQLTSQANNHAGETALAVVNTGAKSGTLVGSLDVGLGHSQSGGQAYTGAGSVAEACAQALDNHASAEVYGESAYLNSGKAYGLLAGAGSYGLTHTTTLAATTAADATAVNPVCLLGQCEKKTPIAGVAATGGTTFTTSGAGSLDGDLALNGTATTGSTGYSLGGAKLVSNVDFDTTYGKIGEYKTWGWVGPKLYNFGWTKHDINGVNGLTGDAGTDATVAAGAGATGDLVGAYAFETKAVDSLVNIYTVGNK